MKKSDTMLPRKVGDAHIRLLRVFKSVVECGGFAAAEVELNISRPAISIAISELEEMLGMRLCHRGRSGFSMTEEGQQVYQATLQLLAGIETFRAQVNAINTELRGELNIGITDNLVSFQRMRITRALKALKNRGSDVIINIRMMPPNVIEAGILDGKLHIGMVPNLRSLPGINYIPLYHEQSLLYCSQEHSLFNQSHSTISNEDLARFDAVIPAYPQSAEIKQQQKILKPMATSTDREGIAFLILTGEYVGFLPIHFADRWVKEGTMKAIQPDQRQFLTHYSAITRKDARPNHILEVYLEELKKSQRPADR